MQDSKKIRYRAKSTARVFMHAVIAEVVRRALQSAETDCTVDSGKSSRLQIIDPIVAMVFMAFCLEAYLNWLAGALKGKDGPILQRQLNPHQKLKLLALHLDINIDEGQSPFQSFRPLFRFRNAMAHARFEEVRGEYQGFVQAAVDLPLPATQWQQWLGLKQWRITLSASDCEGILRRVRSYNEDVEAMIRQLHKAAGLDGDPLRTPWVGAGEFAFPGPDYPENAPVGD